jgi:hypothetical protein
VFQAWDASFAAILGNQTPHPLTGIKPGAHAGASLLA